ncbi:hypothetical protein [Campylobacter troglodytis]|uniref:hypothetical protein n=1 Tax=Campylobacter troglodytis TaxID=654363 RepID=UPI00163B9772|nr:hypothetical protein [Campylobacter troglodytis]
MIRIFVSFSFFVFLLMNFSVSLCQIHKAGSSLGEKSLLTNFGRHFVFSLA